MTRANVGRRAVIRSMLLGGIGAAALSATACAPRRTIRVGVLHSLTGTMAVSETGVVDATLLALERLNAAGGLLGMAIEPVVVDGRSHWPTFAAEAERLIVSENVSVVFGCWTSASRKTVLPVFETHDHLLFYPVQYEGLERSPNIVYLGAAPNQQILPAVDWAVRRFGRRIYLAGSDYVFPRTANAIIRDQVLRFDQARDGVANIVGEGYRPLGDQDFSRMIFDIRRLQPDCVINTVNGDSNIGLFKGLTAAGLGPERQPIVSLSIGEPEIATMDGLAAGSYAAWNYFQSVATAENRGFVDAFRQRFGGERVIGDPMEAAYTGVAIWARAVTAAASPDPRAVRAKLGGIALPAPVGPVSVDAATQHLSKPVRIGRAQPGGQFEIVWESPGAVHPIPYPDTRTEAAWDDHLQRLRRRWNGEWAAASAGGG